MNLPIEIVNKILVYIGELNKELYMTQYHTDTNKTCYKINYYADVLWGIKATLITKQIYPYYDYCINWELPFIKMRDLYSHAKPYYENKLRNKEQF
jgi:hypothetical protein